MTLFSHDLLLNVLVLGGSMLSVFIARRGGGKQAIEERHYDSQNHIFVKK